MLVRFLLLSYWTIFIWSLAEVTTIYSDGIAFHIEGFGGFFYAYDNTVEQFGNLGEDL